MTDALKPPRHRHEMTLNLGANTLWSLTRELRSLADRLDLEDRDEAREITGGSLTAGFHLVIEHDPTMTVERYREALAAWRTARREARGDGAA